MNLIGGCEQIDIVYCQYHIEIRTCGSFVEFLAFFPSPAMYSFQLFFVDEEKKHVYGLFVVD